MAIHAAAEQCPGMTAEISKVSVVGEKLPVSRQTGGINGFIAPNIPIYRTSNGTYFY